MHRIIPGWRSRRWLIGVLLAAFAIRALIPAGFMPSADQPFTLEICPEGFPAQLLPRPTAPHSGHAGLEMPGVAHDHAAGKPDTTDLSGAGSHDHNSWSTHCVFALGASAPPASHPPAPVPALEATILPTFDIDPRVITAVRFRIAQPRAPPFLAS